MTPSGATYESDARLYDIAFSWDIRPEAAWLISRLGPGVRRVLEPACGSGRMFPVFLERGVEVIGVDISPNMAERARIRLAALGKPPPHVHVGDMTRFDLSETLDGAFCPINSFGYLGGDDDALAHLESVARHLPPGGKYLVQIDLLDTSVSRQYPPDSENQWDVECDNLVVRASWDSTSYDAGTRRQTELSRFEVMNPEEASASDVPFRWRLEDAMCPPPLRAGLRAGAVSEDFHVVRKWSWEEWSELIARSPFTLAAVFAGDDEHTPQPLDRRVEDVDLTWHELVIRA